MTQDPSMRASDADREEAATALREAHAEGRLDPVEFQERLDAVFAARTYGDLAPITADLPRLPAQRTPASPPSTTGPQTWSRVRGPLGATVMLVGIWALTAVTSGSTAGFWFVWPVGIMWLAVLVGSITGGGHADAARRDRRELERARRREQRDRRRADRDDRRGRRGR